MKVVVKATRYGLDAAGPDEVVAALSVNPIRIRVNPVSQRILDFDCECRPLHWYGGDWVSKELTAVAWKFIGERAGVQVRLLGVDDPIAMLEDFREAFDIADIVTGHFIRGFDLLLMNGQRFDYGLPLLSDKLTQDTKLDLLKFSGLSKSQENLGGILGLSKPKIQMDQAKWREANRLTPEGIELTRKRVAGDVLQHIEMRARLLESGYLSAPVLWRSSGSGKSPDYIA